MAKNLFILLTALILASCGGNCPTNLNSTLPLPASSSSIEDRQLHMEIKRLFGEPSMLGNLPFAFEWSSDSAYLAFLRKNVKKQTLELWIREQAGGRERPVFAINDVSVDQFTWCGPNTLAVEAGGLYLVETAGSKKQIIKDGTRESIKCSPDGSKIAFVREHNLFVMDLKNGSKERQLTFGKDERKTFGEVTWVYGEEFDTQKGFGWSPDGDSLWFYYTDETAVSHRTVVVDADGNVRQQAYPRAGEANPLVQVGVVSLKDESGKINWLDAGEETDIYLPRVTWHPDSKHVAVVRMDRLQTMLELLLCEPGNHCVPVLTERDPRWVNLLGEPIFIEDGKQFLWLSERSGFSHIYKFGLDGIMAKQLTDGQWVVTSIDAVDEASGVVYFTANSKNPAMYGINETTLSGGDAKYVSRDRGCHRAVFSPDRKHFVDNHSDLEHPARVDLCASSGKKVSGIAQQDLKIYSPQAVNEIVEIPLLDGPTLLARITRPAKLVSAKRYPMLVYVYGGPGAQVVRDSFSNTFQPWFNMMASRGIIVVSVDNRGTEGRGHDFETAIHRRLGEVEIKDQLEGIEQIKKLPYVDPKRIGVFGWSYGGTMTLNALLRTEKIFKFGVAVAPVTDWKKYDTAYTERYMQRPEDNPDGYSDTALPPLAGSLKVPLLLIHGLGDDNVHFDNSATMLNAFLDKEKNVQTVFYPGRKHGISDSAARVDLFWKITQFIEEHL